MQWASLMPDRTVQDFPIFPLGLVALPYEFVPLHIFEPRYRAMFAECLERESEFGIVWATEDGLQPIGCACEIERVIEQGRTDGLFRLELDARLASWIFYGALEELSLIHISEPTRPY